MMPVKFGKTSKQINRQTKKVSIVHEYMKTKSNQELIEAYNKPVVPKLKQKVKNEIVRRNKLGIANIVFKEKTDDIPASI
tara:strand:- start:619 stop:858 length:240 start_codon:yes stop_codon:yes gene_type:complete